MRMIQSYLAVGAVAIAAATSSSVALAAPKPLDAKTRLFVPIPESGEVKQAETLAKAGRLKDALLIATMGLQSHGVWFNGGTPAEVEKQVRTTMAEASILRTVPVLVAYNLPFRDCGQYSAGGALSTQAYHDWIAGFAQGIGAGKAIVILEPDGLGLIPYNTDLQGVQESCQPALPTGVTSGQVLRDARYTQLSDAVTQLEALPNVNVYLDATHTAWLGAGEAAYRLSLANVAAAQGFFVNVSNFQPTPQLTEFGTWIAKCLWFATDPGSWGHTGAGADPNYPQKVGHFEWCASQYYPATSTDYTTWNLTDQWYANNVESQTWVPYPGNAGLTHFVIDSSRNGQGPWSPASGKYSGDPQVWCDPPSRGVGLRPTVNTGNALLDAYLWVKVPGESDGSCTRSTTGTVDPEWGIVDPVAGSWFPAEALQLAQMANPPLL